MKVAVIGASSFSGRAFCKTARVGGHSVLEISRPKFNLREPEQIVKAALEAEIDYMVNFAALNMVAESWSHYADYYLTNVIGVAHLCDLMRMVPSLKKFVQVSTPEVYGTTEIRLMENDFFYPSTPYAVSRAAADMHLLAMQKTFGFPACFTRTVNVYGEGQQLYRIIPKTVLSIMRGQKLKLHGGGVSRRSFIHINDVAEGVLRVMESGVIGETYHMATSELATIRYLVASICGHMKVDFDEAVEMESERPGKDMAYLLDDHKIRSTLGWSDRIPLHTALPSVVDWFVEKERAGDYKGQSLEYGHRA